VDSSEYKQLLIDLDLCNFGGLFIALSENVKISNYVVNRLQSDLPDRFQFILPVTEYKNVFPIFFSNAFESLGSRPVIYHVIGLSEIVQFELESLILNLQNNRESFKKEAYILVFWVNKEIENKIFYLAPDFFHWTLSSYDFSSLSHNELDSIDKNKPSELPSYIAHIRDYLKRVVWQYDNWQSVQESGEIFLIDLMRHTDLKNEFVKLYGKIESGEKKNMDFFLQEFLDNYQANILTLLGDFGTGKTSFSLRLFVRTSIQFLENPRNRIPIFVNLKGYSNALDFREFIAKECFEQFGFPISIPLFQLLACEGAFLFILDGFDEIASVVDTDDTINNFRELAKLTFDNVNFLLSKNLQSCLSNKVFLTCRTHYFFTESQEVDILTKDNAILYRNIVTKKKFHVARIHLALFNQTQIRTLLHKKLNNPDQEKQILRVIRTTYNLLELANRPLLLRMIYETIPFIKDFEKVNAASLYQTYINQCIERDSWNSKMSPIEKKQWMWSIALKLFFEIKGEGVLAESLTQEISNHFDDKASIDNIRYETTARSFLVRNNDGKYSFAHKSFLEYFLAEYEFFMIINKQRSNINRKYFNKEVFYFLGSFIENSNNKNFSGCDFSYIHLDGVKLIEFDLSSCTFTNFLLGDILLYNCNLEGASFENGLCIDVVFEKSKCNQCVFLGVKFRNVHFKNTEGNEISFIRSDCENISFFDFSFKNVSESNFKGTNLTDCSFQYTIGTNSNFEKAHLEKLSFIHSDFSGANFRHANLKHADFGWASLRCAKASYSDLSFSNLGAADAYGAKFNNSQLVCANLEAGNFTDSCFECSNLSFARISDETRINSANFLDAILTGTSISMNVDIHNQPDHIKYWDYP